MFKQFFLYVYSHISNPLTIKSKFIKRALTLAISFVWLINGLFCKLLDLVPRHRMIVARILGEVHASELTKMIGASEVLMFAWILSRMKSRWCAVTQTVVVAAMNVIEFVYAPDLLLFGKMNIVVASFFISVICINEFVISPQLKTA